MINGRNINIFQDGKVLGYVASMTVDCDHDGWLMKRYALNEDGTLKVPVEKNTTEVIVNKIEFNRQGGIDIHIIGIKNG